MSSLIVRSHSYQYELLLAAFHGNDLIYIDGSPSVGKTTLATVALENMGNSYLHIRIDCYEITTCTKLYTTVSLMLKSKASLQRFSNKNSDRISSAAEFNEFIERFVERALKKGFEKIYIILDQVETFKKTSMTDALVVIAKNDNINVIMISNEPLGHFLECIKSNAKWSRLMDRARCISLGPWTKEDLVEVICQQPPKRFASIYEKFVHNIVTLVYNVDSKNVNDLRMLCQESFEAFVECYRKSKRQKLREANESESDDTSIDMNDSELENHYPPNKSDMSNFLGSFNQVVQRRTGKSWSCLPIDRKFETEATLVIISMYIAAHTKPSDDKKNFVKYKKRGSKRTKSDVNTVHSFTLERALQIYNCLAIMCQGRVTPVREDLLDSVLSDVQLLEDINFITKTRGDGLSSLTRYEISPNLSQEYVTALAKTVEISLHEMFGLDPNTHFDVNTEDQTLTL